MLNPEEILGLRLKRRNNTVKDDQVAVRGHPDIGKMDEVLRIAGVKPYCFGDVRAFGLSSYG